MPTVAKFDGSNFELGSFSTLNRYIRRVTNPADARMAMVQGPSIKITAGTTNISWRFECGDLTFASSAAGNPAPPAAGFATDVLIAL